MFIVIFFALVSCGAYAESPKQSVIQPIEPPTHTEIERVLTQFLEQKKSILFNFWAETDKGIAASLSGTMEKTNWKMDGKLDTMPIRLTSNEVGNVPSLYSPQEHVEQLQHSFHHIHRQAGNRFEDKWMIVEVTLTQKKVEQALNTMLGTQFTTSDVLGDVAAKMEVRYTIWYNKGNLDLHQLKVEVYKKDGKSPTQIGRSIYLFKESP